jgi:hypothetical protein
VELQHDIDFPSALVKILDVNKSACTTDNPGLNLVLVMSKEEKTEETWLLASLISLRDVLTALLVLDFMTSLCDTGDRVI